MILQFIFFYKFIHSLSLVSLDFPKFFFLDLLLGLSCIWSSALGITDSSSCAWLSHHVFSQLLLFSEFICIKKSCIQIALRLPKSVPFVFNLFYFIILGLVLNFILWNYCICSDWLWKLQWSLCGHWNLYKLFLICRYKLGSPGFRGSSAEISVEFWWNFLEAGPIPSTVLSLTDNQ